MTRPTRHPATGIYQFRKRVPNALRPLVGKTEVKFSLGTRDPQVAKIEHARKAAEIEARWRQLSAGVVSLTPRQAEAIAGEIYREMVSEHEDDPVANPTGEPLLFVEQYLVRGEGARVVVAGKDKEKSLAMLERIRTRRHNGRIKAWLDRRGFRIDDESRQKVHGAVSRAILQARELLERMESGDYRPDPNGDRFPTFELKRHQGGQNQKQQGPVSYDLLTIFDEYAEDNSLGEKTIKKWRAILAQVATDVPDIRDLTREWVIEWKKQLLAKGLSPKHVRESYVAALRATCSWAIDAKRISENPASQIKVKVPPRIETRGQSYTESEARMILTAALRFPDSGSSNMLQRTRRWVPWICAYTGARVGEIAQLRKQDIKRDQGVWVIEITPEAGGTKDGRARLVAVHPELERRGLLDFVARSKEGPLFYDPTKARKAGRRGQIAKVGERLCKWVRQDVGIIDDFVQPNHAWRHRFKTLGRNSRLNPATLDYIQGHKYGSVSARYGEHWTSTLLYEISKIPALDLSSDKTTDPAALPVAIDGFLDVATTP